MLLLLVIAASPSTFSQNEIKREVSSGEGSSRTALEKASIAGRADERRDWQA